MSKVLAVAIAVLAVMVGGCAGLGDIPGPWSIPGVIADARDKGVQKEAVCACSRETALQYAVRAVESIGLDPRNVGPYGLTAGSSASHVIGLAAVTVRLFGETGEIRVMASGRKAEEFMTRFTELAELAGERIRHKT